MTRASHCSRELGLRSLENAVPYARTQFSRTLYSRVQYMPVRREREYCVNYFRVHNARSEHRAYIQKIATPL